MEYIEVTFDITPYSDEYADIVVAEIEELGFESYLYEESGLKAYIKKELFDEHRLRTILSGLSSYSFSINHQLSLVKEENWNAVWESSFEPVVVKKVCTIKAPYHQGLPKTRFNITINPKMAFGTGHHQTTSLMIEWIMDEHRAGKISGKQILDMGCGTGVLAILCAKMKAALPLHAIDIDPTAVSSAKENCWINRVHRRITVLCGDASLIQSNKYDLILANINRNILLEDISTYTRGVRSGGTILMSGFYEKDISLLRQEAEKNGLTYIGSKIIDDWAAIKFVK